MIVTLRIPVPGGESGHLVKVYYSQDSGSTWSDFGTTLLHNINGTMYAFVNTPHATIFAIG